MGRRLRIERGLIVAVEIDDAAALPASVRLLDARGDTVRPGRVALGPALALPAGSGLPATASLRALRTLLAAGVTSAALFDLPIPWGVALRRHVGTGRGRGPRLFVGAAPPSLPPRAAVQALLDADVDFMLPTAAQLTAPTACALLAAGQRQGMGALTHVAGAVQRLECTVQMPPGPNLRRLTVAGVAALGMGDALGLLRPGFRADLLVLAGPPQAEAAAERVRAVVLDGVVQAETRLWPGLGRLQILWEALWMALDQRA